MFLRKAKSWLPLPLSVCPRVLFLSDTLIPFLETSSGNTPSRDEARKAGPVAQRRGQEVTHPQPEATAWDPVQPGEMLVTEPLCFRSQEYLEATTAMWQERERA